MYVQKLFYGKVYLTKNFNSYGFINRGILPQWSFIHQERKQIEMKDSSQICLLIIKRPLKTMKKTINNHYYVSNPRSHSTTHVRFPFNWPRLIHYFIMPYMEIISHRRSSRCYSQVVLNDFCSLSLFLSPFSLSVSLLFLFAIYCTSLGIAKLKKS